MRHFTLRDFTARFPDDSTCLEWLKNRRWPNGIFCPRCNRVVSHQRLANRRAYCCGNCGRHIYPTAGTVCHKSATPLRDWFYVIFLMASTRCGISAKQVQRELGVTYKTAWRMCHQVRKSLQNGTNGKLGGEVEMDETYFGPKKSKGKRGRGAPGKTVALGVVERGGRVRARRAGDVRQRTLHTFIWQNVEQGATVHTDQYGAYSGLNRLGYTHCTVDHQQSWVQGSNHVNTIEGFWGIVKNAVRGVHRGVSSAYLDLYLSEYGFRYDHRNDETPMFWTFLQQLARVETPA